MSAITPTTSPMPIQVEVLASQPIQRNRGDRIFFRIITGGVLFVPALVILFLCVLCVGAYPAMKAFGWGFLGSVQWDANAEGGAAFGALPAVYGTVLTSLLALLITAPVGIAVAAFLSEIETSTWSLARSTYTAIPIVAFMAPIVTMTDFAHCGPLVLNVAWFLLLGGLALKFVPDKHKLPAISALGFCSIFSSVAMISGAWDGTAVGLGIAFLRPLTLPVLPLTSGVVLKTLALAGAVAGAVGVIKNARSVMPFVLEILATIPSVVYGMWGMFVLAPWIAEHIQPVMKQWQPAIDSLFGMSGTGRRAAPNLPLFWFRGFPNGLGLGTAVLVLSIMVLPMIVSISLDAMRSVPRSYREAALGLGATRWEMIRIAVLPPARSGIFGGCILALGRALGETMAVTMVIGNAYAVNYGLFLPGYSISSIIANEYGEAEGLKLASMMELALILFVLTMVVNLLARLLVKRSGNEMKAAKPGLLKQLGITMVLGYAVVGLKYAALAGLIAFAYPIGRAFGGWIGMPAADKIIGWAAVIGAAGAYVYAWIRWSHGRWRKFTNAIAIGSMGLLMAVCIVPLGALLYALFKEGGSSVGLGFLVNLPKPPGEVGGGIGNAILGMLMLLIFGALFAVPLGLALGIYLTQRATTRLASVTRLLLDVLSGIPAIIVGVFIYTIVVRKTGFSLQLSFSTLAGALAYAMIMLPIFARATEEALKAIPRTVDEAGLGLGLPRRTVVMRILIRAAIPTILTALFLSLARVGGEAAPLLFTTQGSSYWPSHSPADLLTLKPLREPVASLPLLIYEYSKSPYQDWKNQAWGASLVLVCVVLSIRLLTRGYLAWRYGARETHV